MFCNKIFAFVLLSIIKDPVDYIESRNDQGENIFFIEKNEKNAIFLALLTSLL